MVKEGEQSAITDAASVRDVERGGARRRAEDSSDEEEGSQCFSDAEDQSLQHSHSRQDSSVEDCISSTCGSVGRGAGAVRVSECSLDDVDLEAGGLPEITKASPDKAEANCRICHLGLDSAAAESGAGIVLGCSCKDDLSRAHKQCAETWFKIRGNKICESVAQPHATWQVSVTQTSSSSGMSLATTEVLMQLGTSLGGFGKGTDFSIFFLPAWCLPLLYPGSSTSTFLDDVGVPCS